GELDLAGRKRRRGRGAAQPRCRDPGAQVRIRVTDALEVDGPNPWLTRSSRVVFENEHLRLKEDQVTQPDGEPGCYVYLELPWPVVAIVPVDEQQHVYLIRQWRYPWRRNSWEIPAGHGEPGETPVEAAQR